MFRILSLHGPGRLGLMEREPALGVDVYYHRVAFANLRLEQLERQRVLHALLDHALERPRTVDRVVALLGQLLARRWCQLQRDLAVLELLAQPAELDLDDLPDLLAAQRLE